MGLSELLHDDGKRYYSISEVSEILGETTTVIRNWEKESGLLKLRRKWEKEGNSHTQTKGERLFTRTDLQTLRSIQYVVRKKGIQLSHVKDWLKLQKKTDALEVPEVLGKLLEIQEFLKATKQSF